MVHEEDKQDQGHGYPDICSKPRVWKVNKPQDPEYKVIKILRWIGILVSFLLGLIIIPLMAGVLVLFFIIPRIIIQGLIWLKFSSKGISILPLASTLSASGYEFYTVLFIIKGRCQIDKIRKRFQLLIDSKEKNASLKLKYPQFWKKLGKKWGYYCSQLVEKIDLKQHIRMIKDQHQVRTQSEVFQLLQPEFKRDAFKVNNNAPDWEVLVIPRFKYDQNPTDEEDGLLLHNEMDRKDIPKEEFYAIALRAHSAVLEKEKAFQILKEEIVDSNKGEFQRASSVPKYSLLEKLLVFAFSLILAPFTLFTRVLQGAPFPFGQYKKGNEEFQEDAYQLNATRNLSIKAMQLAKKTTGTTVTSILVCCAGCAARNMLLSQDKPLPTEYRFSMKQFLNGRLSFSHPSIFHYTLGSYIYSYPLDKLNDVFHILSGNRILPAAKTNIDTIMVWMVGLFPANFGEWVYQRLHNVHIMMEIMDFGDPFNFFGDGVVDVFVWNAIDGTYADFGITTTTYAGRVKANFVGDNESLRFGSKIRKNLLPQEYIEEYVQIMQPCDIRPKDLFPSIVQVD